MYDSNLLKERMAELNLNFQRLGKKANVDPKTAKSVVTRGTGNPDSIRAVIERGLELELKDAVKRSGDRNAHLGATEPRRKKAS